MLRGGLTFWRNRDGSLAVEFALLMPVLILLIIGIVDYGQAMTARAELDAAARAGLQVLIRNIDDTAGAVTAAEAIAPDASVDAAVACVCSNGVTVACIPGTCPTGVPRRTATVAVTRDYSLMMPWPTFDDPLSLEATAVGRLR